MSDAVLLMAIILGFIILLFLNIFLMYIPLNRIENSLTDIDTKVENAAIVINPVIERFLPLLEGI